MNWWLFAALYVLGGMLTARQLKFRNENRYTPEQLADRRKVKEWRAQHFSCTNSTGYCMVAHAPRDVERAYERSRNLSLLSGPQLFALGLAWPVTAPLGIVVPLLWRYIFRVPTWALLDFIGRAWTLFFENPTVRKERKARK